MMKLAQTSKLETKEKSRLFFRKISLLAFLLIFSIVSLIDILKVNKGELTRENFFKILQLVANASESDSSPRGSDKPSPKDKNSIKKKRRVSINKKRSVKRRPPAHITRIREPEFFDNCISDGTYSYTIGSCNPSFKGKN